MTPRGRPLVDALQTRFDAELAPPSLNEIELADKTLIAAARLFYGAVVERLAFEPANPDYFTSREPGALRRMQLERYELMGRTVMRELGSPVAGPDPTVPVLPEHAPAWGGDAPPPGARVRDTRHGVLYRVIRSRRNTVSTAAPVPRVTADSGWKCLCERVTGDAAGEQEWIPAGELKPDASRA